VASPQRAEPLTDRMRRLRSEQGLSRSQLSRATVAYDGKGLAEATVKAVESGINRPGPTTIAAIAHALGADPRAWPEYRLALARQQLDEREVGLDQALATLMRFEEALSAPDQNAGHAAPPALSSHRRAAASARGSQTPPAT
jgi:transcriptional regulator with XRE-family HTH domain